MTLFEQWKDLIENQTEETFRDFWEEYSGAETKIYSDILDGINSSLKKGNDFESFDENSEVEVEIVPETLFYNMLVAEADYLYGLPQWMDILGEDKIKELTKKYKQSKTVVKGKKIGRNDPCPCGSGKKYKHCCGRN